MLFGLHLVLIGDPSWTSQSVPRVIGVLLAMAGLGYLVDSIDAMAVADYSLTVGAVTFVGEVVFVVWLLVRGGRTSTSPRR